MYRLVGFGILLVLLSATVLAGAGGADAQRDASPVAPAADGDLDPNFGSGGKATTDFSGQDIANALAIQSDGKILAGGSATDAGGNSVVTLARYTITGTLDTTYGSGGKVITHFDGKDAIQALGIQSDGKTIAAGSTYTGTNAASDFALARYTTSGSLDTTYGSGGKVKTDFNAQYDSATALGIQSDGKTVAAGTAFDAAGANSDFALARYNANGTLDGFFGAAGKVTTDIFGSYDTAYALAIQSDGKIVVAGNGQHAVGDPSDFALARYDTFGTLDGSFGVGGKATTDFNGRYDLATALGIQSDGKIVVAGYALNSDGLTYDFALARYNANGTLDASFGAGGKVTTDFNGSSDRAAALRIQSDGKIVVAGFALNSAGTDSSFALARYTHSGTLDGSFGAGGKVITDFSGILDGAFALGIQKDGKIVAAGSGGPTIDFALARYDNTTPGVQDLSSSPGPAAGQIVLRWSAPDVGGGTPASAYDLRYSNAPIDDLTWLSATQAIGEPSPAAPGMTETLSYPGFPSSTRWYFALKFQDFLGNWSALSNLPSLVDIGFRPPANGFSFVNFTDSLDSDLTFDDMVALFNSRTAVCYNLLGPCIGRVDAAAWRLFALANTAGGHCEGFSIESLRFYKGIDNPASVQPGASNAAVLTKPNARHNLTYYFVPQLGDPVKAYKAQQVLQPPSTNLNALIAALSGTASDPMNLIIRFAGTNGGGHAMTPYAVEERSNHFEVWVYNSNSPTIASSVLITTTTESWSYNMGGNLGIWSGNPSNQNIANGLGVIPISESTLPLVCPWCLFTSAPGAQPGLQIPSLATGTGQVWLTGAGHLLITDSLGQRLGYAGSQFVNEIPGATGNPVDGGLGIALEPIYDLPLSQSYRILLDGQTLTQTRSASLAQFGPDYASGADDIPLDPTTQDQLVIAPDGSQVVYQPNKSKAVTLKLATDSPTQGYQFRLGGTDLTAGQPVTATVDSAGGQLIYNNRKAGNGDYNLDLTRANAAGQQSFTHGGVPILATDTHFLKYADWDGTGALTLLIDHGGDGTIDETVLLGNQTERLYLPLIAH